jgi:hypothetical protein
MHVKLANHRRFCIKWHSDTSIRQRDGVRVVDTKTVTNLHYTAYLSLQYTVRRNRREGEGERERERERKREREHK